MPKARPGAKIVNVSLTPEQHKEALYAVTELRYQSAISLQAGVGDKKMFEQLWSVEQKLKLGPEFKLSAVQYSMFKSALKRIGHKFLS